MEIIRAFPVKSISGLTAILASISNSSNVAYNLVELPVAPMSYSLNS